MFYPFGFNSFLRVLTDNVLMREKAFESAHTLKIDLCGETFTSQTQQPRRTSVSVEHIPAKVFEYLSYCRYRFWCTYPSMSGSRRVKIQFFPDVFFSRKLVWNRVPPSYQKPSLYITRYLLDYIIMPTII